MKNILVTILPALILFPVSTAWAAGAFIRAFYPDDQPVLLETVNPHTVAVPATVTVQTVGNINVGGQILAAPVLATQPGLRLVPVNDGHLYHHRAYDDAVLWWSPKMGRWRIRDDSSTTGWRYLRHEWDLDPPDEASAR